MQLFSPMFCFRRPRFFVVFGLRGPFSGPGAFKNEPRMKNRVGWTPGGVRGPILSGFRSAGEVSAQTKTVCARMYHALRAVVLTEGFDAGSAQPFWKRMASRSYVVLCAGDLQLQRL